MKKYILLFVSIFTLIIPIFIVAFNYSKELPVNYIDNDNMIYTIYLKGEVKREGELQLQSSMVFEDFIYDYLTDNSDLDSFADEDVIENNKTYYIAYKEKVSINEASLEELKALDDVGTKRGNDIINSRPYNNINELVTRTIIPSSIYEKIKNDISI